MTTVGVFFSSSLAASLALYYLARLPTCLLLGVLGYPPIYPSSPSHLSSLEHEAASPALFLTVIDVSKDQLVSAMAFFP